MFAKISVKGRDKHALYKFLTQKKTNPKSPGEIRWNFAKLLVGPNGQVIARFGTRVKPLAKPITQAIEKALPKK